MLIKDLQKLGLSEKEAKVYLAALELAEESVQNIAAKAGVNRPTAYVVLEKLIKFGLVSTRGDGKKTLFSASDPRELKHIIEKTEKDLQEQKETLKQTMDQLEAIHNAHSTKPVVRYFEGVDGLEAMDRFGQDDTRKTDKFYSLSAIDLVEKFYPGRRKTGIQERVKSNIKTQTIYTAEKEFTASQNKLNLREGIIVQRVKYPLNGTIKIIPNWGIKLYYFDEIKPYGVIIESSHIAENMIQLFKLAWIGAQQEKKK